MGYREFNFHGRQQFTTMGMVGAILFLAASAAVTVMAFVAQSQVDGYIRDLRYDATLRRLDIDPSNVPTMPSGAPIWLYAALATIAVIGAVLMLVGREMHYVGRLPDDGR